jgi:hypothetical protein
MQSFQSTSFDRELASFFVQCSAPITDETTRIIFEFHLDTGISDTKPYADIKHLSYFHDEEELLLMPGTTFRIGKVEYNEQEKTWIGILDLCSDYQYQHSSWMNQRTVDCNAALSSTYEDRESRRIIDFFSQIAPVKSFFSTE